MDYTALNEITETIIDVMQRAIDATGTWPGLEVQPELLKNTNQGVGFYLYHVQESGHYKNFPPPGRDVPPVRYTPMALNLFYQLSPNKRKSDDAEQDDAYDAQRLMSVAMKALHDNPVITRTLVNPPQYPLGKEINIKITLQNVSPSESVQYWAASESAVRLSAYYEVSVVFLEPERPRSYAGRVLTYNNFVFVQGAPRITGSENTIEYTVPDDPVGKQVKIGPAQAPPAPAGTTPLSSTVRFFGNGFEGGGTLDLLLTHSRKPVPAVATAGWSVRAVSPTQVNATVRETAVRQDTLAPLDVLPGLYAAQVRRTEQRTLPDGTTKEFRHVSNQFPFSVTPRIDAVADLGGGAFTITGYRFQHADLRPEDVQVFVGEESLERSAAAPLVEKFQITGASTINFQLPAGLPSGNHPLRVMVNGIESPPRWIKWVKAP
ncbi:MAG: DUF4255 domain-containing protein [Cytophagales bacterium]|nr:DUF4255 domain-containing protein [Cytophagales bacterium]